MAILAITLTWPPATLAPNGTRAFWRVLAKSKKNYRYESYIYAFQALTRKGYKYLPNRELEISIVFYPPDKRKRDLDNMLASIKSGLDGIADAIKVDDSKWKLNIKRGHPASPGRVELSIDFVK